MDHTFRFIATHTEMFPGFWAVEVAVYHDDKSLPEAKHPKYYAPNGTLRLTKPAWQILRQILIQSPEVIIKENKETT